MPTLQNSPAPHLQILGPVTITHAQGRYPDSPARITELIAFLSLHPWPNEHLLDEALWPGQRVTALTRNRAMTAARSWLGVAPDGAPYVSLVADAGYRLHPDVTTDWDQIRELIPDDPATADTEQLKQALPLITGQPFSGTNPARYCWAETDRAHQVARCAQIALELAGRCLRRIDPCTADLAISAAITIEPANEIAWRIALRVAHASAIPGRLESVIAKLHATLDPLGALEPQTRRLIARLQHSSRPVPSPQTGQSPVKSAKTAWAGFNVPTSADSPPRLSPHLKRTA